MAWTGLPPSLLGFGVFSLPSTPGRFPLSTCWHLNQLHPFLSLEIWELLIIVKFESLEYCFQFSFVSLDSMLWLRAKSKHKSAYLGICHYQVNSNKAELILRWSFNHPTKYFLSLSVYAFFSLAFLPWQHQPNCLGL